MAKLAGLQAAVQAAMSTDGAVGRGGCKFCNARLEELNRRLEAARNSTAAQNAFLNEDRRAPHAIMGALRCAQEACTRVIRMLCAGVDHGGSCATGIGFVSRFGYKRAALLLGTAASQLSSGLDALLSATGDEALPPPPVSPRPKPN
jgi:hypothetical protein